MGSGSSGHAGEGFPELAHPVRSERLAIFMHGLGKNGAHHGRALSDGARQAGWHLHFATSVLGSSELGTFRNTLAGVRAGGERLANEVRDIVASVGAREIVLIGASMGGLYCRYAAGLLWGDSNTDFATRVRARALVTLASPHLGVRGLFSDGSLKMWFGRRLTQSCSDLMWDSDVLSELASGSCLRALQAFDYRIAYAPVEDDGIVAYSSAALTPHLVAKVSSRETLVPPLVDVHRIVVEDSISWCGPESESFIPSEDAEARAKVRNAAVALLSVGPWTIVDVGMNHREIAGLYPNVQDGSPNFKSRAIASDVWERILAAS